MTLTEKAIAHLKKRFVEEPDYAWAWHCNIAVATMDEGLNHTAANRAAARFMCSCFGVDTTQNPCFEEYDHLGFVCHGSSTKVADPITYSPYIYGETKAYEFAVRTKAIAQEALSDFEGDSEGWWECLKALKLKHTREQKIEEVNEIDRFLTDYAAAFCVKADTIEDYLKYLET